MRDPQKKLAALRVKLRSADEKFHRNKQKLDIDLHGYWRWSNSDLLNNAARGVLAEYLVASDLGCTGNPRVEWNSYDFLTKSGKKVEVKSAAYLQSWKQKKLSVISFNIAPTFGWDAQSNEYATEAARQADVYVFCLLAHKDKATVDPLNVAQWRFFVLLTEVLDDSLGPQKTIGLNGLLKLNPAETEYGEIGNTIDRLFA